ncbi:MAG: hypothetical protein Q7J85_12470 [Bacillota bacterium]|nr:hypothetical protein [Bacillota bacterium]
MKIESIMKKYENKLMSLPDVVCVGIGIKSGRDVIKIFVKEKTGESISRIFEKVPKTLDGYETDVEEIGEVISHAG